MSLCHKSNVQTIKCCHHKNYSFNPELSSSSLSCLECLESKELDCAENDLLLKMLLKNDLSDRFNRAERHASNCFPKNIKNRERKMVRLLQTKLEHKDLEIRSLLKQLKRLQTRLDKVEKEKVLLEKFILSNETILQSINSKRMDFGNPLMNSTTISERRRSVQEDKLRMLERKMRKMEKENTMLKRYTADQEFTLSKSLSENRNLDRTLEMVESQLERTDAKNTLLEKFILSKENVFNFVRNDLPKCLKYPVSDGPPSRPGIVDMDRLKSLEAKLQSTQENNAFLERCLFDRDSALKEVEISLNETQTEKQELENLLRRERDLVTLLGNRIKD